MERERSLASHRQWGRKESNMTERLTHTHRHTHTNTHIRNVKVYTQAEALTVFVQFGDHHEKSMH